MIIKRELGEKGQVVIPKDIREFLGLRNKENVVFEIRGDEVLLRPEQDAQKIVDDYCDVKNKSKNTSIKKIRNVILERYNEIPRC